MSKIRNLAVPQPGSAWFGEAALYVPGRSPGPSRRQWLGTLLALGSVGWAGRASACEYMAAHLRITHPWTRATSLGATQAVLCMTFDEVTRAERLIGVETPVAGGARMGGRAASDRVDFEIPPGVETHLAEEETFVTLTDLKFPLQVGRAYPLMVEFEHSGVVLASLTVDFTPADPSLSITRFK